MSEPRPVASGTGDHLRGMRSREEELFEELRQAIADMRLIIVKLGGAEDRADRVPGAFHSAEIMAGLEDRRPVANFDLAFIEDFLRRVDPSMLRAAWLSLEPDKQRELLKALNL